MSENTNPQEPRQPRNLFEQILFGVQVTNDNIVTLHGRVDAFEAKINAIYDALYPTSEPNASGADEKIETVGGNFMNCNKIQAAVITPVLAAGSVASPYFYEVNITQRLCYPTCADNTPVFNPQFSLKSLSQVGTGRYVATVHVEGIISYVPCNGGCGCTKQQPLSQDFTIPIQSASTPTVTIEQGAAMNAVAASACQPCSRTFVSETPITVTVATAATPTA